MQIIQKTRLEAFSDGVFAIIITLLVLEIKVPHLQDHHATENLISALRELLPKFVSWVISFLMVAVIWINHHRLLETVSQLSASFFWLNANLLLWTSFIPFPTALLGDYAHNTLAVSFYGIVFCLCALAFVFLRLHLLKNPHLVRETISTNMLRKSVIRSVVAGPVVYLAGAGLAWVHPVISWIIYFLIPVYFIFPVTQSKEKA
jgi:uncharacterized membrane protein